MKYGLAKMKLCGSIIGLLLLLLMVTTHAWPQNSRSNPQMLHSDSLENNRFDWDWKYVVGDNPDYKLPEYNDSAWQYGNILRLDSVKPKEIVWLRYYIKADKGMQSIPLFLEITQNGASEIYLDGKKIDSLGTIHPGQIPETKNNKFPPTPLVISDTGLHIFAVRFQKTVAEDESTIGKFTVNAMYLSLSSYQTAVVEEVEQRESMVAGTRLITGIFLALGFIHLLLFAFFRKAAYNFFFGCYNLSIALISHCISVFVVTENIKEEQTYLFYVFVAVAMFGFSLTGFVNTLFGKSKIRRYILLIIPLLSIFVYQIESSVATLIIIFYIGFVAIESFYLIIKAMIKKQKSAFIVGGGILVFFLVFSAVSITLIVNGGQINTSNSWVGPYLGTMLIIVLISFPISISAYLAWQFASTNFKLQAKLDEVEKLSAFTLEQEKEKQHILASQNEMLEQQVSTRTQELQTEKQKSDDLLLNILPQEVAEELKATGTSKAQHYDEVSVLFTDFVNFTMVSEQLGAEELLNELNENFTAFDRIMEKHGLEKIKTIGDAYLAVSGLPVKSEQHAQQAVAAALDIIEYVNQRKQVSKYGLDIRIGINSGALVAGIVGVKKFAFDIWGDTVNTAARMEQSSEAGKVNISESTYLLVKDAFACTARGKINAKGKGEMEMYFVEYK